MAGSLLARIREAIGRVSPNPGNPARREALALQSAWCRLLLEVARIDPSGTDAKRAAVERSMCERFPIPEAEMAAMMADAEKAENRLTSYYEPVTVMNRQCSPVDKTAFIEQAWRIAVADGQIDAYEDDLVRKLADLLYVEHADFILAKHRVLERGQH